MNRIKETRLLRGIRQKDFARIIGITPQALNNYENGRTPPSELMIKMSSNLHVTSEYLLGKGISREECLEYVSDVIYDACCDSDNFVKKYGKPSPSSLDTLLESFPHVINNYYAISQGQSLLEMKDNTSKEKMLEKIENDFPFIDGVSFWGNENYSYTITYLRQKAYSRDAWGVLHELERIIFSAIRERHDFLKDRSYRNVWHKFIDYDVRGIELFAMHFIDDMESMRDDMELKELDKKAVTDMVNRIPAMMDELNKNLSAAFMLLLGSLSKITEEDLKGDDSNNPNHPTD